MDLSSAVILGFLVTISAWAAWVTGQPMLPHAWSDCDPDGPLSLLDVVEVSVFPNYQLRLRFESGERRVFDMSPYMRKTPFDRIKDPAAFAKAYVALGTVVWPGEIDIDPETLYDRSLPVPDRLPGETKASR